MDVVFERACTSCHAHWPLSGKPHFVARKVQDSQRLTARFPVRGERSDAFYAGEGKLFLESSKVLASPTSPSPSPLRRAAASLTTLKSSCNSIICSRYFFCIFFLALHCSQLTTIELGDMGASRDSKASRHHAADCARTEVVHLIVRICVASRSCTCNTEGLLGSRTMQVVRKLGPP